MKENRLPLLYRIKASAGAGKTYQLAIRYIKILNDMSPPSREKLAQVVAITFTNKAASEMKERILTFLKEIALQTDKGKTISKETGMLPDVAFRWLDTIISHYSDFHVRTIDSLLYAIIRCLSFELGLPPESRVSFNISPLASEAFDIVLAKCSKSATNLLEKTLYTFLQLDEQGGFYPEKRLKKRLLSDILPKIRTRLVPPKIDVRRQHQAKKEATEAYREFYQNISEFIESGYLKRNLLPTLDENTDIENLCGKAIVKREAKEIFRKKFSNLTDEVKIFEKFHKRLKEKIENWENISGEIQSYAKIGGYTEFLIEIQKEMEALCRRESIIAGSDHWTDIVSKEIAGSGGVSFIYPHFGAKFKHFLFDEFQDTSRAQWNALYPLFEEALSMDGSLFVVGDIKQAIYRWRGGDWKLFNEILDKNNYFATVEKPIDITLSKNYRSQPELVDFFNSLFEHFSNKDFVQNHIAPHILPNQITDDIKASFAENLSKAFVGCTQDSAISKNGSSSWPVTVYRICSASNKEEAKKIIKEQLIDDIRKEWDQVDKSASTTPIAVLVRKNDEGEEVSSWLIRENIPVITENALKLRTSHIVKGIICFLEYIFEHQNEVALYGFLASGILQSTAEGEDSVADKWIMQGAHSYIEKVKKLKDKLTPLINRKAPYELIWEILDKTDLIARLDSDLKAHRVFVERLLEVTHQFQLEEGPSLSRFLDFWHEGGLDERVGQPENIRAVRILTIHKAKGLEFPVVFVPFTDWKTYKNWIEVYKNSLVYLSSSQKGLPDELFQVKRKILTEEAQEIINLFYVALTRAEKKLYIYFYPASGTLSNCIDSLIQQGEIPCQVHNLQLN